MDIAVDKNKSNQYKVKPEVLAFLKKIKKKKCLKTAPKSDYVKTHSPHKRNQDTDGSIQIKSIIQDKRVEDQLFSEYYADVTEKLEHKQGNIQDLITSANNLLQGKGKINFVAVKGSGRVSKVVPGGFQPVLNDFKGAGHDSEDDHAEHNVIDNGNKKHSNIYGTRPYKCTHCRAKPYITKEEYEFHKKCHLITPGNPTPMFYCPVMGCDTVNKLYSKLIDHIVTKHQNAIEFLRNTETYENSVLGSAEKRTSSERKSVLSNKAKTMATHMQTHSGEMFSCSVCAKCFPTSKRLNAHLQTHDVCRPKYICIQCKGEFANKDGLKKHHQRFHENVEKLSCPYCSYTSRVSSDMKKHIVMVHEKLYHCDKVDCDFRTNNERALEEHTEFHQPQKTIKCQFPSCYFATETDKDLNNHMVQKHQSDSKHQCMLCCKLFRRKTQLLRHLGSHVGGDIYKCLECKQTFHCHSTYYRHRKKTGHDKNREGVVSVPQNLVIQLPELKQQSDVHSIVKTSHAQHNSNSQTVQLMMLKNPNHSTGVTQIQQDSATTANVINGLDISADSGITIQQSSEQNHTIHTGVADLVPGLNISVNTSGQLVIPQQLCLLGSKLQQPNIQYEVVVNSNNVAMETYNAVNNPDDPSNDIAHADMSTTEQNSIDGSITTTEICVMEQIQNGNCTGVSCNVRNNDNMKSTVTIAGEISGDQNGADEISRNQNSADEISRNQNSADEISRNQNSADEISLNQNSVDEISLNQNIAGDISSEQSYIGEVSGKPYNIAELSHKRIQMAEQNNIGEVNHQQNNICEISHIQNSISEICEQNPITENSSEHNIENNKTHESTEQNDIYKNNIEQTNVNGNTSEQRNIGESNYQWKNVELNGTITQEMNLAHEEFVIHMVPVESNTSEYKEVHMQTV